MSTLRADDDLIASSRGPVLANELQSRQKMRSAPAMADMLSSGEVRGSSSILQSVPAAMKEIVSASGSGYTILALSFPLDLR